MKTLDYRTEFRRTFVSVFSMLAMCVTSLPVLAAPPSRSTTAPPTATAPPNAEGSPTAGSPPSSAPSRTSTGPSGGELSGDEAGSAGPNACKKWPANKKFTITIPRDAELEQLVQWMMTISCQKFIWNEKIRSGKVTILSPEKVSLSEAYAAFYAAIESMGLTVEPAGDYFKIVESTDAKSLNLPVYEDGSTVPNNDRFVTQLVQVKPENVKDLTDLANKLHGKQGSVEVVLCHRRPL
jgi:general secretion pathway protein D